MLFKALLVPLFFCSYLNNYNFKEELKAKCFNEEIKNVVEENIGKYKDNIAVYYYKLDGSEEYYLNESKIFVAASLSKVPQAMEGIDKINNGELSFDAIVQYSEEDYEEGTGVLRYKEKINDITVREALELSLLYSDNIAKNMLNRICGYDINDYISKITGEKISVDNLTSVKEQAVIYYKLYHDDKYSLIVDLLKKTYCHDRIDKYLDYHKVAHKFGNYYRYYHDGGIIFEDEPYILIILTKDVGVLSENLDEELTEDERMLIDDGKGATELIANISKDINCKISL